MKYLLFCLAFLSVIIQGCSSKQAIEKPKNVDEIKDTKTINRLNNINIVDKDEESKSFKIFLNSDNKIKYICLNNSSCNYYDDKKHSYSVNSSVKEDIIWLYKDSFSPDFSKEIKGIQCGRGSMAGVFILIDGLDLKNHNKDNLKLCYNRFTKLDSMQIFDKVLSSVVTLGSTIITSGNMHTVRFDWDEFKEAVVKSNLDKYQKKLFDIKNLEKIKYGFDVVYLNHENLTQSLQKAYESYKFSEYKRDGIIFIDEKHQNILSIIDFKNYKNTNVINNLSFQINDILKSIVFDSKKNLISYDDILKYIPKKIQRPILPQLPILEKSEFETKKEFRQRVFDWVKKRESQISQLQKQYNFDILQRNEYITSLENSYKNYLKNIINQTSKMQEELKANIGLLSKILFLQNTQGFDAKEFKYNAERKKLYFKIFSKNKTFNQKVVSNIPSHIAKEIKINKSYNIEPILEYKNRYLALKGFNIHEPKSLYSYKVFYTNINFTPLKQRVTISTQKEEIENIIDSKTFKDYKQKNSRIISKNESEIWYIDVVNRMNSKVPKWFSTPDLTKTSVAFAQADTLEEAKSKALHDLALIKDVKVSATIESTNEFGNSLKNYHNLKKSVQTKTNVRFTQNEYRILKQEKVDGIWYVSLALN